MSVTLLVRSIARITYLGVTVLLPLGCGEGSSSPRAGTVVGAASLCSRYGRRRCLPLLVALRIFLARPFFRPQNTLVSYWEYKLHYDAVGSITMRGCGGGCSSPLDMRTLLLDFWARCMMFLPPSRSIYYN